MTFKERAIGVPRVGGRSRTKPVDSHHAPPTRAGRVLHFLRHLGEMMVAMLLGMVLLDPLYRAVMAALGYVDQNVRLPELSALAMMIEMTVPMMAWMCIRGHDRARTGEMASAMVIPTLGLIALSLIGVMPAGALAGAVMLPMLPAMVGVMLWRWNVYSGRHARQRGCG